MKVVFGVLMILVSCSLFAQEVTHQDTTANVVQQDSLAKPQKPPSKVDGGIFLEAMLEGVPGLSKRNFSQQFGLGIKYKRFTAGVYQNLALGKTARTLIFPNEFELNYAYGGTYLGVRLLEAAPFFGVLRINYGLGDMIWERSDTGEDFLRDTFQVLKPEVLIGYRPTTFLNVFATAGYRKFLGLDIAGTEDGDFSGVTFAFGIQLGYFND